MPEEPGPPPFAESRGDGQATAAQVHHPAPPPAEASTAGDRQAQRERSVQRRRRTLGLGVGLVVLVVGVLLVLPITYPDGDTRFAIAWGSELLRGQTPSFEGIGPIKHPLTLAGGAIVSILPPQGAINATAIGALLTFALLGYATFRLGRLLAGTAAGALAVVVVLSRPEIILGALTARKDLLFAALVISAAALVASAPRKNRGWALALLAAAGLIRPEAWVLAAAYGTWLIFRERVDLRTRRLVIAAVLSAPLIWALSDLILTGSPLHTIGSGSDRASIEAAGFIEPGAAGLQVTGLRRFTGFVEIGIPGIIGWPATIAAILVVAQTLISWRRGDRSGSYAALIAIAAIVVAMLGVAVVLNVFSLPLQDRFLIVAAVAVGILAASALAGARSSPLLGGALAILVIGILVGLPGDVSDTRADAQRNEGNRDDAKALAQLAARPAVKQAIADCPEVEVASKVRTSAQFGRATLAIELEVPVDDISPVRRPRLTKGGSVFGVKIKRLRRKATANRNAPRAKTVANADPWGFVSAC